MIKSFVLASLLNNSKKEKVFEVIKEYRYLAQDIASIQWRSFFEEKKFDKDKDIKSIESPLSARYKQTCQYQVVGMLESFISNRQNDFRDIVNASSLDDNRRKALYRINRRKLWFRTIADGFNSEDLALARSIMRRLFKRNRKPSMKNINMALDFKVAKIISKEENKASSFDYWIQFSTLEKGKPILIPIKANEYFNQSQGVMKNFCQLNIDRDNNFSVAFLKEQIDFKKLTDDEKALRYQPKIDKIGLDFGLNNLFATSTGDLYGREFKVPLEHYDAIITKLAKRRQKQKLKVRSPRYDKLVSKIRSYLKNEINRVINSIIEQHKPKELIVERLSFQSPKLSKRMNRILSKFGKKMIQDKFKRLEEEFGIITTQINPAYTSQECQCGYIAKSNRKSQSKFLCGYCLKKANADINASRILVARSSCKSANIYLKKETVLRIRIEKFLTERSRIKDGTCHNSLANILASNPYFKGYLQDERMKVG